MSDTVSVTLPWHASPEFLADVCRRLLRHGFDFRVTHTDDTVTFHVAAEALATNCLPRLDDEGDWVLEEAQPIGRPRCFGLIET